MLKNAFPMIPSFRYASDTFTAFNQQPKQPQRCPICRQNDFRRPAWNINLILCGSPKL
ncbi:hypothetical protein HanPSC8_Chr17g0788931 [Helianthus annuus]|nr:hypothetical protein HanPSC8_Chr17g0788931 [Helianthus annuus]